MVANMAAPPQFQRKRKEARQKFSWNHKISGLVSGPVTLYIGKGSTQCQQYKYESAACQVQSSEPVANAVFNKLNSSMRKHTFKFQDTYQTKGGPEIQQNTRSQREVSIGSNRAANQAVYQAFNISAISYRVVIISRHQNSWTTSEF